jgi:stearoyl-CoA desaturase (delta-9 desaturase)
MFWVTGGYHRYFAHKSYKTSRWFQFVIAFMSQTTAQKGALWWAAHHREHHRFADTPTDVHSPRQGFWWSHMGWIVKGVSDHREVEANGRLVPDLANDAYLTWLSRWNYIPQLVLLAALYLMGGVPFVLWGIFVRVVFSWHATCFVNSAAHVWGRRRFETRDDSTNNWWVALLTFGEGWHNNHHAYPTSAQHGLKWYEVDLNWYGICALKKLGLAHQVYGVKLPPLQSPNDLVTSASQRYFVSA